MADKETETGPAPAPVAAEAPPSPTPSDKSGSSSSGSSGGSGSNKFYTLFQSIQKNIETLNYVTKEIEKMNDRLLFHSSTISAAEESSLIQKVSHLHKDTSMKARDTSRMIKHLRVETTKPTPSPGSEMKSESEKSKDELADESRDMGDRENICKKVTRSFTDEVLLYQSAIQDFKNELKERLTKTVQSIRPKASEDFVDMSLRSESSRYALFREIMATEEKDLSEEDAKALKDEIAEKYVAIAELSTGAAEFNKIFLNLAASADPNASGLSDSSDDENKKPRSTTRSKKNASASSDTDKVIDELLGDRYAKFDSGMDASTRTEQSTSSQGQRRNRLFSFMKRHRRASTESAKKLRFDTTGVRSSKRRGTRASRWMTLFLLATVALAAIVGIVMIH